MSQYMTVQSSELILKNYSCGSAYNFSAWDRQTGRFLGLIGQPSWSTRPGKDPEFCKWMTFGEWHLSWTHGLHVYMHMCTDTTLYTHTHACTHGRTHVRMHTHNNELEEPGHLILFALLVCSLGLNVVPQLPRICFWIIHLTSSPYSPVLTAPQTRLHYRA